MIKIEPNFILRGTVFACQEKELCNTAQDQFLKFMRIKTLSTADLYAGKICAALDRQHPRDLFDIKLLLENEGLTKEICQAFIVYLARGPRPMHEMLEPKLTATNEIFIQTFKKQFAGMTAIPVDFEDLNEIRLNLPKIIVNLMSKNEKAFLISFKSGVPDWTLCPIADIEKLPAIQWKLHNIKNIPASKKDLLLQKLINVLR
jgi:Nucleotidyl transferase AbiEii toxin, Type IV TA system